MGTTRIEWCDKVWNPVTGCNPVSDGCQNCYAARMAKRLRGRFGYPKDEPFRVTFHPDRINEPFHWRKPQRIFVCSMGDLFHANVQASWLVYIWATMLNNPKHIFMLLTKRAEEMKRLLTWEIPANVWLGVSVEDQKEANHRIPILLSIPAPVHFVSVEPMLGPVDLTKIYQLSQASLANPCSPPTWDHINALSGYHGTSDHHNRGAGYIHEDKKLNWVIAGPETGPGARRCDPAWIVNLWQQCKREGVPFFDKGKREWLERILPETRGKNGD